ncbi:hypothetical protein KEM56_007893 [Ascosphaera pollenicola]|nr:hypothetical protein KEM56_007893 [Ascosphaera pollenicola]
MACKDSNETSPTREGEKTTPSTEKNPSGSRNADDGEPMLKAVRAFDEAGQRTPQIVEEQEMVEKAGIKLRKFKGVNEDSHNPLWISLYHCDVHRWLYGKKLLLEYEEGAPELELAAVGKAAGLYSDQPQTPPERINHFRTLLEIDQLAQRTILIERTVLIVKNVRIDW